MRREGPGILPVKLTEMQTVEPTQVVPERPFLLVFDSEKFGPDELDASVDDLHLRFGAEGVIILLYPGGKLEALTREEALGILTELTERGLA